jgi:hypothetical protein
MTSKSTRVRTPEDENIVVVNQSQEHMDIERLIAIAGEFSAATGGTFQAESVAQPAAKRRFNASHAAISARNQLEEITRLKVDSVSAVSKTEDGWEVIANVVELLRIPHSTDVISSFTVVLDDEGELESYRRTSRYTRDQTGEEA